MARAPESDRVVPSDFTGRIDHRLSVIFAALLVLVLLLGGASLYLLGSLLRESHAIARQSEQVHLAERVHATLQRFLSEVEGAHARGTSLSETVRATFAAEIGSLLGRCAAAGGDPSDIQKMRVITTQAGLGGQAGGPAGGPAAVTRNDVNLVRVTERAMEALAERISAGHKATEQRQVRRAEQTLRLTIGVDLALVIGGAALLLAAQRYFRRAISVPLRRLAEGVGDVATGAPCEPMPVTSSDEIGRLTHAFNRMAEQRHEHEERLKGFAMLDERQRLARELHDSLAQDLALLRLKLVEADRSLGPEVSTETRALVREMLSTVDAGYQDLREAIFGLQALDVKTPAELITSLGSYLNDFGTMRKIPVTLHAPDTDTLVLSPQAQTQLVRIVHEALSNIGRHAGAGAATVTIETAGDRAHITIADDGRGFVPDAAARDPRHFGLRAMTERAESVGGTVAVRSEPGRGTRIILELPLEHS